MGNSLLSTLKCYFGYYPQMKLLMLGLDAAGKTSILYRLKLDTLVNVIPTVGFNIETIRYRNIEISVCDLGGGCKMHLLWPLYFKRENAPQALIYVVDSN